MVEVRVPHFRLVLAEPSAERFAHYPHPALSSACHLFQRHLRHDVHDVQWDVDELRHHDRSVGCLRFNLRGPRESVALWARDAHVEDLVLSQDHQVAVLGVHHGDSPNLLAPPHPGRQLFIRHHQSSLVGHEELVRVDALLGSQVCHVLGNLVVPAGDGHVEAVVHRSFFRLLSPLFVPSLEVVVDRKRKIDVKRGAAGQRRAVAGEKVVCRHLPHERHLKVCVWVDPPRHHVLPGAVHCRRPHRHFEVRTDGFDDAIFAQHICFKGLVQVGDSASAQDNDRRRSARSEAPRPHQPPHG
mmetsp:Transcript_31163/g.81720  ORF Transcript_31163/g.81720 Transcript_31163/m.81720 type:complete len:299 (+) Transcript_31163:761-1657(+)